jgi:hypothetical protein
MGYMSGVRSLTAARSVLATTSRMNLRPAQPPNKWVPSALTSLVKLPEREAEVVNSGQRFDIGHPLIFKRLYMCHGVMWPCHLVAQILIKNTIIYIYGSIPPPPPSHQLFNSTPRQGFIRIPHLRDRLSLRVCYYTID